MDSILQTIALRVRESQETLEELEAAKVAAIAKYSEAVDAMHEAERIADQAAGKVELQKNTMASYLKDAYQISEAGLNRIGR